MSITRAAIILTCITIFATNDVKAQLIDDVVSAEVTANRSKVYVNEEFQIVIAINSTGVSLDQQFQLTGMPDASRLVCKEFRELPAERNMQGAQIREKRRFCCDATAIAPGILAVAPALRIGLVSGFGPFRQISRHEIRSKALSLPVLPLPEAGKPAGFSGAVGQFSLDVEISPSDVAAGDLITVTTMIRGKGYLEPVSVMNVSPGANFKVYPARSIPGNVPGEKVFEQILVPQSTNAAAIPRVSFSFFDPLRDSYMLAGKGPFPMTFHPPRKATAQDIYRPGAQPAKSGAPAVRPRSTVRQGTGREMSVFKIAAIAAYWTAVVLVSFWITLNSARGSKIAIGVFLLAAVIFLPLRNMISRQGAGLSTAITIRTEKARLAPAYSALISFNVPRDSALTIVETHGSWSKIQQGDKKGWMPSDSLTNSVAEK